jgi:predicted dehydrogenase
MRAAGSDTMDRVRLAIIGCGNIAQLNVPGYLQHPRCDVTVLCDPVRERAELRARQWDLTPRICTDYTQVLDDPAVDALELLTPTYLHAEQIIAGLAAGKHVSCQKPLSVSVAEADRVVDAVTKAGTTFRVTENFLYYPPIVKAKELLDAGVIGEPSLLRIHTTRARVIVGQAVDLDPEALAWRRDPARNPGGALYDDGVHKYATAAYWIGEIGEVSAIVSHTADFLHEAPSVAAWRFEGRNCLGIVDYTYAPEMTIRSRYYGADEFFEIHGSRGILWVTRCTGEMLDLPPVVLIRGTETTSYQVPMDWRLGFDGAAKDFVDGLLEGRQPAQDVHTAKKILQVPLAIYEASRTRRPVAPGSIT